MVSAKASVGRRRLLALADYVQKNARRAKWRKFFDMSMFVGGYVAGKSFDFDALLVGKKRGAIVEVPINNECGTSGCLLGHATNVPSIYRAGLRAIYSRRDKYSTMTCLALKDGDRFMHEDDEDTIGEKLFGIRTYRCRQIFHYEGSDVGRITIGAVTPIEAVRNLRKIVKEIDKNEGWTK